MTLNPTNHPRAIKQKSLSQIVAEELRKRIWTGELSFGERLLESELSHELDVSRSSLREAFQTLEYEGLVVNKARKGTFVYNFTKEDMKEINELRYLIEVPALVKTASIISEADIENLESIFQEMMRYLEEENWYEVFNLDMTFHITLVRRCGNSRIIKMYQIIQTQIRTFLSQLEPFYVENKRTFSREHSMLLEAFKNRNREEVEQLAKEHIQQVAVSLDFLE